MVSSAWSVPRCGQCVNLGLNFSPLRRREQMTTPQIDTGTNGAKRQSWRRANPRDVLKRLIDRADLSENKAEEKIANECWDILHRDQMQMRTVFEYWFANNYRSLIKSGAAGGGSIKTAPQPSSPPDATAPTSAAQQPSEATAGTSSIAAKIREKIEEKIEEQVGARVKIVLLDMMMPTGKLLRYTTREELVDLDGWAQRLVERLQPGQTVEAAFTEDDLRGLYQAT
jgi:hypothetical protein